MKVFVFGAGASQAAQNQSTYTESHNERAPLVDGLFNEQYIACMRPGINFDIEECRAKVREYGSLEKWLTEKWKNISNLGTLRAQEGVKTWFGNINLYTWILLNSVSQTYPAAQGYSPLLQKLYEQDFGIISFNYDTLLDQSYMDVFGEPLSSKKSYLDSSFVKLHGSVNWFLKARAEEQDLRHGRHNGDVEVRLRAIAKNIYNGAPMSMNSLEIIDPKHSSLKTIEQVMNYFANEGYFYPLLFMPLTGKAYDTISDFKDVMIAKAEEMLTKASDVYFVGYRASDDLIHELLKKVPGKTNLHVIGRDPESIERIFNSTSSMNPNLIKGTLSSAGFTNFVENFK